MNDARRENVKKRYEFETWTRPVFRTDTVPWRPFLPAYEALQATNLYSHLRRIPQPEAPHAFTDVFDAGPDVQIAVTVVECDSPEQAQERLVDLLLGSMVIQLPRCEERRLQVGDVGFCGVSETVTTVWFSRDNVLVRIENFGTVQASVAELAQELDRQIINLHTR